MFNKSYNVAAAERANKELTLSFMKVKVKLLDETSEMFSLSTEAKGVNLLDAVCDCLEILERDYFGIQYKDEDEKTNTSNLKWLKLNKLIRKQIKTELSSKSFYFRVRFVPSDIIQMQESYTRYQLFLQIKQDILVNRILCHGEVAIQLAGCSLQSELWDYNPTNMKANYVGEFRFVSDQTAKFESDVAIYHKSLKGLKPEDAELQYINIAKQLPQYGCDLYTCQLMDEQVQFGLHANGITVFPSNTKSAFILPWNSIEKVLNKGKCFLVKVLIGQPIIAMGEGGATHSLQKGIKADNSLIHQKMNSGLKFIFQLKEIAKEAWRNSIEMHSFFRVKDPKQIQAGGTLKRSQSFFKFSSVTSLFTGRRTLPELMDIRRRNRMMERSFSRIPSKRYKGKNQLAGERQSVVGSEMNRPSGIIYGKSNPPTSISIGNSKNKIQDSKKRVEISNSESSDDSNPHDFDTSLEPGNFRQKSNITQSVRVSKTFPTKDFQKHPVIHSSMPRQKNQQTISKSQSSINQDASPTDPSVEDITRRSNARNEANRSSNWTSRYSVHELKSNKPQSQSSGKLSGSMSSMKNILSNSINAMTQSTDKLIDSDTCVEIAMRPQDSKYGFTIKGGFDTKSPVIVSKVVPNSAADQCIPKLYEGDQIIKINDKFADELTNDEIKEIIRATGIAKKENTLFLIVKPRLYLNIDDPVSSNITGYSEDEESLPPLPPKNSLGDIRNVIKALEDSLKDGSAVQIFEKLYKQKQGLSMNEAKKSENINKNRYKDILPYDQTRILVRNSDYINANNIKVEIMKSSTSSITFKYIAGQGPMAHTASDFLTMIWENKTELVVMLTDLQEKGRSKCYKYWPDPNETTKLQHGLQISCESEKTMDPFILREFRLKKSNETRRFTHLQYINWPDHDVPVKMDDFMSFMKMLRQIRSSKTEPIVVHCSAGIGRTGVVITMDIAISYMELKQPFSVLAIVKDIRNQRAMLIQSQKQFEFVCRAIVHYYNYVCK